MRRPNILRFKLKKEDGFIVLQLFENIKYNSDFETVSKNWSGQVLRNAVHPKTGLHIFNHALERMDARNYEQKSLF